MNPEMSDDPTYPESNSQRTRYERVKEILNRAQEDAHPSYEGHDRFWNLPHYEFLKVTLYGIRMIAPAKPAAAGLPVVSGSGSCCHTPAGPTATAPKPGRGAASGLIQGLKADAKLP
jgi:tyrosinase